MCIIKCYYDSITVILYVTQNNVVGMILKERSHVEILKVRTFGSFVSYNYLINFQEVHVC